MRSRNAFRAGKNKRQQKRFGRKKGFTQTDYIIAIGIFIVIFGLVVLYVTNYLANLRGTAKLTGTTDNAFSLLSIADFNETPTGWPEIKVNSSTALLMHFSENSTASGGAKDLTPNGNNGTAIGGAAYNLSGKFGSAWTFDGVDDVINGSNSASINFTGSFSVSAWVFPRNSAAFGGFASKHNTTSGQYSWWIGTTSSGNVRFLISGTGSDQIFRTGSVALPNNTWHHVAGVYDAAAQTLRIFINGTEDAGTLTGTVPSSIAFNDKPFMIGRIGEGGSYFNGSIDEVAIYNVSLSAADILNHSQYERRLDKIGLKSMAYRFIVKVNNSKALWYNQSANHSTLTNEIVSVNLNNAFSSYNINSTVVYNPDNNTVSYRIDGTNISFVVASLAENATQWYRIYVDDDGIFANLSKPITGTDNMSETIIAPEEIYVLDNQKLAALNASSYNLTKNATGFASFRIRLYDLNSTSNYIQVGDEPPRRGDIVALQRYFLYQNSTGGVRPGRLTIQTW